MKYFVKFRFFTSNTMQILSGVLRGVLKTVSMLTMECHAHEKWYFLSCGYVWAAMIAECVRHTGLRGKVGDGQVDKTMNHCCW